MKRWDDARFRDARRPRKREPPANTHKEGRCDSRDSPRAKTDNKQADCAVDSRRRRSRQRAPPRKVPREQTACLIDSLKMHRGKITFDSSAGLDTTAPVTGRLQNAFVAPASYNYADSDSDSAQ